MNSRNKSPLFWNNELRRFLGKKENSITTEVERAQESNLLKIEPQKLADELVAKYSVLVPKLDIAHIEISKKEIKVDVSKDPLRTSPHRSGPVLIDGTRFTYHIPFTGDYHLFDCKPSTFSLNPPLGIIVGGEIQLTYEIIDPNPEAIKSNFETDLAEIQSNLNRIAVDVDAFNNELSSATLAKINQRLAKIAKNKGVLTELGFPVRSEE